MKRIQRLKFSRSPSAFGKFNYTMPVKEAAKLAKVTEGTIKNWCLYWLVDDNPIGIKKGGKWFVDESLLTKIIEGDFITHVKRPPRKKYTPRVYRSTILERKGCFLGKPIVKVQKKRICEACRNPIYKGEMAYIRYSGPVPSIVDNVIKNERRFCHLKCPDVHNVWVTHYSLYPCRSIYKDRITRRGRPLYLTDEIKDVTCALCIKKIKKFTEKEDE